MTPSLETARRKRKESEREQKDVKSSSKFIPRCSHEILLLSIMVLFVAVSFLVYLYETHHAQQPSSSDIIVSSNHHRHQLKTIAYLGALSSSAAGRVLSGNRSIHGFNQTWHRTPEHTEKVPDNWLDELMYDMLKAGQEMLHRNVKKKEFVWRSVPDSIIAANSYYDMSQPAKERALGRKRPTALFYLGWVAYWNMEVYAQAGGPQGEFVMWADLAAGMAAIGFKITFVNQMYDFWRVIKKENSSSFGEDFDVILTDYDGLGSAENTGHFPFKHCKYYIVDFFGTDPAQNSAKRNMDLKRFLTPYPYQGHNTAVNLVMAQYNRSDWAPIRENSTVLWAKEFPQYEHSRQQIVSAASQGRVHTFLMEDESHKVHNVFSGSGVEKNIIAHGFQDKHYFWKTLTGSKVLLGTGLPIDGPTALEAIAHGVVFINPRLPEPVVIGGHPNRRVYTSQHLFVEQFIKPPYAYTFDTTDSAMLNATIRRIFNSPPIEPFVHPLHQADNYIVNIRKVFDDQHKCSEGVPEKTPKKHPANAVYESFLAFAASGCGRPPYQGGCEFHWLSHPEFIESTHGMGSGRDALSQLLEAERRAKVASEKPMGIVSS